MIFSDSPSQKAFERMMTQVKSFPPRCSGVVFYAILSTRQKCATAVCVSTTTEKENAQSANAHALGNESLPEQRAEPRSWPRQ